LVGEAPAQVRRSVEKVGFYLRHRQDIEEWAALRTHSLGQFEDAFARAAEVKRGVHDGPHVEESDSAQWRWYGFEVGLPAIAPARAFVAYGWTHSQLFGSAGETLPYVGIKIDGASQQVFVTAKELLRDAAQACHWPKGETGSGMAISRSEPAKRTSMHMPKSRWTDW
jgi:hypothetical protein